MKQKHYKLEEQYIPAHNLCLKMLKKYPELHPSYDGQILLNNGKYPEEDFIHGLWIDNKIVPWASEWSNRINVYGPSCFCGSAVPIGKIYVYGEQVKFKENHPYCSSDDMELEEQNIDKFMALVHEAQRLQKNIDSKNKLKEIKKDFQ